MPLISTEESRFIEASGGEFQGFVDEADGGRRFEDILISRHAFYDEVRREVIDTFIATEAVNDDGGNELVGPSDVRGFKIMIVRRSLSGDTIDSPQIIALPTEVAADSQADLILLRQRAHEAHKYVIDNVAKLNRSTLETQVKAILATSAKA